VNCSGFIVAEPGLINGNETVDPVRITKDVEGDRKDLLPNISDAFDENEALDSREEETQVEKLKRRKLKGRQLRGRRFKGREFKGEGLRGPTST
jgi:hypothetical protein